MARHGVRLAAMLSVALLVLATVAVVRTAENDEPAKDVSSSSEDKKEMEQEEHYPTSWLNVDIKTIIDNDRLFKKYKNCILAEKNTGCPKDVVELKKILPEVLETTCSKCLPEHVAKVKETLEYICKKRRADYDEVKNQEDPTGELTAKFIAKFGNIDC